MSQLTHSSPVTQVTTVTLSARPQVLGPWVRAAPVWPRQAPSPPPPSAQQAPSGDHSRSPSNGLWTLLHVHSCKPPIMQLGSSLLVSVGVCTTVCVRPCASVCVSVRVSVCVRTPRLQPQEDSEHHQACCLRDERDSIKNMTHTVLPGISSYRLSPGLPLKRITTSTHHPSDCSVVYRKPINTVLPRSRRNYGSAVIMETRHSPNSLVRA